VSYNASKGGLSIGHEEGSFSPEELVAMVLTHATDITKGYGGLQVKDAVLIAPSFFTQTERQVRSTQHQGETGGGEANRQADRQQAK
jgi:molecular chaperone DnaK (HSP70)